jgi:hypothetical protein
VELKRSGVISTAESNKIRRLQQYFLVIGSAKTEVSVRVRRCLREKAFGVIGSMEIYEKVALIHIILIKIPKQINFEKLLKI